jgi:hypothetical protein
MHNSTGNIDENGKKKKKTPNLTKNSQILPKIAKCIEDKGQIHSQHFHSQIPIFHSQKAHLIARSGYEIAKLTSQLVSMDLFDKKSLMTRQEAWNGMFSAIDALC